ncbi:MAG TPA: DNA primase [Candidatus Saccharibacteria bacterium]|nr:DNA primase [Candidatus Saccharibacteria bacterium]
MQDAKEEVRSRLNIEDVIGEYVQLKRAGRNFKGLSPFSNEKTPSFFVSPDKQIWHDFSSNKGGDIFSFVMEVEGFDFRASLEHLARKAGVDLSIYDSQGGQEIAEFKKKLYKIHDFAKKYYQQSLIKNQHAMNYVFKKRGLSKQVVQDFGIGYAPDSGDALVKFLIKKGFSNKQLSRAGLTNRFGGDLFRGRMILPLTDPSGQVIGFTGRIITDEPNAPKYLNTPQTILYDKGRHVFGLSLAKESIRKNNYSVIVEGNLDVVSSHQSGVTNVVATAGTAMTENHLKALSRLSNDIRLAFDSDKAGLTATERAIAISQNVGVDLTIITLPKGVKDPDELIKKDSKLWQQSIAKAEPAIDWVIKQYASREDMNTAIGKRRFTTVALNIIKMLRDSVEQEHYLSIVAKICDSSIEALKEKLISSDNQTVENYKKIIHNDNAQMPQEYFRHQDDLLAVFLIDLKSQDLINSVDIEIFSEGERRNLANYLKENYGKIIENIPKELLNIENYVKILLLKAETRYVGWSEQNRYLEATELLRKVVKEYKQKQKDILTDQLRDAETMGDEKKSLEISIAINELIKETRSGQKK